jgi:hypothetical protein
MKDRILFLFDMGWIQFGIAKFFLEKFECEPYAIIDIDNNTKNFFKNQKIVKLNKSWYYRDYLPQKTFKVDYEYLKQFEKKYGIDIWKIAYSERFFNQHNPYYQFNEDEILSIIENTCKLFESVLDEVNPTFLIIKMTDSHQSHLLHQLCRAKGIRTMMLGLTRIANRFTIYDEYEKIEITNSNTDFIFQPRSQQQLEEYLTQNNLGNMLRPSIKNITKTKSIFHRIKKYLKYLSLLQSKDVKNYYAHYGKTPKKVISQFIFFKKIIRERYIDKNFKTKLDYNQNYILFTLHVDPERQTLLVAPYYTNQLEVITALSKSIPVGFKIYVKEHYGQRISGWRELSYYKKIKKLPNVELIHPSYDTLELIKNSSMVCVINGTSALEAALINKPSMVFADTSFSSLPSVHRVKSFEKLSETIRTHLDSKVDFDALNNYINLVEQNSFEFNFLNIFNDFSNIFSDEFNTARSTFSESKMNIFLENHKSEFSKLADKHIYQINHFKEIEQNG